MVPGPTEPAAPERDPVWGYADLALFAGVAVAAMLVAGFVSNAVVHGLRIGERNTIFVMLPAEFVAYGVLFGLLALLLRVQYGKPFWASLGWTPVREPALRIALAGVGVAMAVAVASVVLKTPDINSPMKQFLSRGASVALLAVFGTTLGPLCEELAFRGFMQPLFVRTMGVLPGVLLPAVLFGLLHLPQYGLSWRHGLLITGAGAAFGWMRHKTGSTRAAVIMHMAYNCTFFLLLLTQRKDLPHNW
jgi:membrane protease YdiL (CAAX protease family)